MIALYLLAAHLLGDFVLQTRWQAAGKLTSAPLRARHVASYLVPFVPLAFVLAPSERAAGAFLAWLAVLHYLTDSERFKSTLGDVLAWRWLGAGPPAEKQGVHAAMGAPPEELEPNPWPPIGICIDQALHVCQLAVLAGIFLR